MFKCNCLYKHNTWKDIAMRPFDIDVDNDTGTVRVDYEYFDVNDKKIGIHSMGMTDTVFIREDNLCNWESICL